jgi:TonB family protein
MPWICLCGTSNADSNRFCGQCGNDVSPTTVGVTAPGPPDLIDQLPRRLDTLLSELLEPNETVHIKLKGAFKEVLVCTNKRVLILKAGFMTGQTFGSNVFQVPYHKITSVQVKKHLMTGYFELSAGGIQNRPTSFWQTGQSSAEDRENCVSLNSSDAFRRFREASSFILSGTLAGGPGDSSPRVESSARAASLLRPTPSRTPSGSLRKIITSSVVAGLLVIFAIFRWLSPSSERHSPIAATPQAPQTPAEQVAQTENGTVNAMANPRYAMGQEFSVGYFSYRVNKVEVKSDPSRGPVLAVDITVRNDDSSESMTPMLKLLDENGKDYGRAILELATRSGDLLTELQPNVINHGYAVFDNAPINGKYLLLVSGGLTSGRSALVPLIEQAAAPTPALEAPATSQGRENGTPPGPSPPDALLPSQAVEQPSSATSPTALPTSAANRTSGALCNGMVEVPQNGELVFNNLPGGRLKFTFDHDAWHPIIHRQPDGTQTLVMRSIKPGIQTKCDIRWESALPMPIHVSEAQTGESQNSARSPRFAFVGTVTNTTNPSGPLTAPVRMRFDPDGSCILTIRPPLIGSGTCKLTQYDEKSGHIEITSKGVANISWSGSVNRATATGIYKVGDTGESGSFQLTIELPGSDLTAIGRALTTVAKAPPPPAPPPPAPPPPSRGSQYNGTTTAASPPILVSKVEPDYSEEARRAKFNGDVRAAITIDGHGNVTSVTVLDSPGLGLDEKIIVAVRKWKFKPAMKGGVPVATNGVVTLTFRSF